MFSASASRNGKEAAVKIGAFPTKAAARREADRWGLREQANAPLKNHNSAPVTFGRVVGMWLKKELGMQAVTSQKGIRSYLRCHILPKWRRTLVNEIKPRDMRDWLHSLHDDEERAIFAFGMFEEVALSNPARDGVSKE